MYVYFHFDIFKYCTSSNGAIDTVFMYMCYVYLVFSHKSSSPFPSTVYTHILLSYTNTHIYIYIVTAPSICYYCEYSSLIFNNHIKTYKQFTSIRQLLSNSTWRNWHVIECSKENQSSLSNNYSPIATICHRK